MKRIVSIDVVRGLAMVIMALDHTRDFLHVDALTQSPTDMATTTPLLFCTRWITHLCAPTFVFLSGLSAYISLNASVDRRSGRKFLFTRGAWLLVLEFTLVNFALSFDLRFRLFLFEVIATIGVGFMILAYLSRFSPKVLLITGLVLIAGHDALSMVPMPTNPVLQFLGSLLLGPGAFPLPHDRLFVIGYPILPWLGILLLGFAAGRLFERPASERNKILRQTGWAFLGLFILLRCANIYGDPSHWAVQKNGVFSVLSFLNVSKYPPSLMFSLCMLGILLLALSIMGQKDTRISRIFSVFGRTPLFYFLLHLLLIHGILIILAVAQRHSFSTLSFAPFQQGRPAGHWGLSLPVVYLVWLAVVLLMYPFCLWYGRYKEVHRNKKWLRYL